MTILPELTPIRTEETAIPIYGSRRTPSDIRFASDRRYSQPRHPARRGLPITKLERLIASTGKFSYEVAAEIGIHPSILSQINLRRRAPTQRQILDISHYFGVDPKEIFGDESPHQPR